MDPKGARFSNHASLWVSLIVAEPAAVESKEDYVFVRPSSSELTSPSSSEPVSLSPFASSQAAVSPQSESVPVMASQAVPCVKFVADVTCPDGSSHSCGSNVVKTWEIKNVGDSIWDNCSLVY